MKICVFGAGAIGGYLAVELALAGNEICAIAPGEHLKAIKDNGLRLIIGGKEKMARISASDNPADFGPQDYVICTLKAHQSHESTALFAPLLGPDTAMVTAMNGTFHGGISTRKAANSKADILSQLTKARHSGNVSARNGQSAV